MRSKILTIIEEKPKHYTRIIGKDNELLKWVNENSLVNSNDLVAKLRSALYQETNICEFGNTQQIRRLNLGFQGCGPANKCECTRNLLKNSVKVAKSKYSESDHSRINQKRKVSMLKKYGVEFNSQREDIKHIWTKTKLSKEVHTKLKDFEWLQSEYITKTKSASEIANNLGVHYTTVIEYCHHHGFPIVQTYQTSQLETQVAELLDRHKIQYIKNDKRILSGKELDFYLPKHQVAIEVNGLYWHSYSRRPDKNYHFRKWQMCREQGIDLYQWFSDDIRDAWPVIQSKIQYLAGVPKPRIGARMCKLRPITYQEARPLLENNHIQGTVNGQQYVLGAYHNDCLVGVMGFAHRKGYLELTRFATDLSNTYPGLFSRMLKYSLSDINYCGDVVSFSDNAHSNGAVYQANGFELDKILGPAYWYTRDYQTRHNRQGFMKSKIAQRFDVDMAGKTEWQAMQELGWDRIWDAGKIKWVLKTG
jgi:hypothetical protein